MRVWEPGIRRWTLNAFGERVNWIGRFTEYEFARWRQSETEHHLKELLDFQVGLLDRHFALATGRDHGWPKTMPWWQRVILFRSYPWGYTPKRAACMEAYMQVHCVMNAVRDLLEWEFAESEKI